MTAAVAAHDAVVNGVRLHYVEAGSGPLVILLHGFPEFHYSWRHQVPALAAAGYRVLAPDLRGYNESDKPAGVASYRIELLTADVAALVRHAGAERAVIVGHDWGGAIAWHLAMSQPEVVERLAILNAPHPAAFLRELRTLDQLRRSWYIFFFQLPRLPEWAIRRRDFAGLERLWRRDPVRPDAFTTEDIAAYKRALAQPGALTATINYYRAVGRRWWGTWRSLVRPIDVPTLLIWGERDRHLTVRLTEGLDEWVRRLRVERLAEASHWVQQDAPERVNELLLAFLTQRDDTTVTRGIFDPLNLYPHRSASRYVALYGWFLTCALATVLGAWLMANGAVVLGLVGGALFGFLTWYSLRDVLPGASFLQLSAAGLMERHRFETRFFAWQDICDGFRTRPVKINGVGYCRCVAFQVRAYQVVSLWGNRSARLPPDDEGHTAIHNAYGANAGHLAAVLNEWYDRFGSDGTPE